MLLIFEVFTTIFSISFNEKNDEKTRADKHKNLLYNAVLTTCLSIQISHLTPTLRNHLLFWIISIHPW